MRSRVDIAVGLARLAIGWEALWAAAFPTLMVAALFAAAVLSGLLALLPDIARFAALGLFASAFLWSLKPLAGLRLPAKDRAMRRVEIQSGLIHRPVSGAADTLSDPGADELSRSIWEAHKLRQLSLLERLKSGWPRSALPRLDPNALRLPVILALVAALFLHKGDPGANLADAVRLAPSAPQVTVSLDAWIAPPAYTAKPPLMLTSPATVERLAKGGELLVPENSALTVRVTNAAKPRLAFYAPTGTADTGAELPGEKAKTSTEGTAFKAEAKLARPVHVKVFDGDTEIAQWQITLLPDAPPKAAFVNDPVAQESGSLAIRWKASDDYGIAAMSADIALSDTQNGEVGIAGNGVFLFDPPEFPISLKKAAPKDAAGLAVNDLTAHPWAGLDADITLEARDQAGKTGVSQTKTVRLPERRFDKLLARALIEQRKALVMEPDETEDVEKTLEALTAWPEGLIEESGIHIAIEAVRSRLRNAQGHDDVREAIDLLWQIATGVEEGDLAGARAELEALRKELQKALAEGASPERIAELMNKMRAAMDRYMREMAEQAKRNQRQGAERDNQRQQGQMREISRDELQKMLDQIENLSKSGANEAAQELLAQLDQILKNLQMGNPQEMQSQRDSPMGQMLDELSEMMRRQQQLMDDTQQMPGDGQEGQLSEQDGGREPNGRQGNRGNRPSPGTLAEQQEALRQMLDEMMRQMGQQGMQAPPALGEAGKSMQGAGESLRGRERGKALGQQGEALSQLREGAQSMARDMMNQQGTGAQGNQGRHGEARGDDRDPLGRPMPNTGEDTGPDRDMLPSELAIRRAREILDMLRSRANIPDLPRLDRDYLDRLLRGLY